MQFMPKIFTVKLDNLCVCELRKKLELLKGKKEMIYKICIIVKPKPTKTNVIVK